MPLGNGQIITPTLITDLEGSVPPAPYGHTHGESGWDYFWKEVGMWLDGNNRGAMPSSFNPSDPMYGKDYMAEWQKQNGIDIPSDLGIQVVPSDSAGTSGKTAGSFNLDSILGNSAFQASSALQGYYDLYKATGNEAYLEKLYDNLFNLEGVQSARDWDKMMSDTQYSRMLSDIQNAGYNPWLMLQNGGSSSASYNSASAAHTSGSSASSQAVSEANNKRSTSAEIASSIIRGLLMVALFAIRKF